MQRLSGIWILALFAAGCAATDRASSRAASEDNRAEVGPRLAVGGMAATRGPGPGPDVSEWSEQAHSRGWSPRRGDRERDLRDDVVTEPGMECMAKDGRRVVFDLLHAEDPSATPLPAVIIFGGDARRPVRLHPDVVAMVGSGRFVCLSVTTTSMVDVTRPAQATECQAVVDWVRDNADSYGMHPGRIGIWFRFADADFVCTLERGTTAVLTSQVMAGGELAPEPDLPPAENNVAAFFNRNLRGEAESQLSRSPRGRMPGGMRPPRF
jgi:hypothetical protein